MTTENQAPETKIKKTKIPRARGAKRPTVRAPSTATAIKDAERALVQRKAAHRKAFRVACVKLFNDYGYALEAGGDIGAHLKITELRTSFGTPLEALLADIPE